MMSNWANHFLNILARLGTDSILFAWLGASLARPLRHIECEQRRPGSRRAKDSVSEK
ncbi:hypothetical protein P3T21_007862, partial [Paraburkholderia sp. GAS334]